MGAENAPHPVEASWTGLGWSPVNIITVLCCPIQLFQKQSNLRGIFQPLMYFALLRIPTFAVTVYYEVRNAPVVQSGKALFVWITGIPIAFAAALAAFFAIAGFFHLFIRIFGGKRGFEGTFRVMAYAGTPYELQNFLINVLPMFAPSARAIVDWLLVAGTIWSFGLCVIGSREVHGISARAAFGATAIPTAIIVSLIVLVMMILVRIAGVTQH